MGEFLINVDAALFNDLKRTVILNHSGEQLASLSRAMQFMS
jgi:hypothetical protein